VLSGETVVAIHSSTNISGEKCTTDNPCEVAEDGTVTAEKGRSYAQQVGGIPPCLTKDSRIDLHRPGCALTRPEGFAVCRRAGLKWRYAGLREGGSGAQAGHPLLLS